MYLESSQLQSFFVSFESLRAVNKGCLLSYCTIVVKARSPLLALLAASSSSGIDSKLIEQILQSNLHDDCRSILSLELASFLFLTLSCRYFALLNVILPLLLLLLHLPTELLGVPTSLPPSFMSSMHYLPASMST